MPHAEDFGQAEHELSYLAVLIKQRVRVPDLAARFGFDYSTPGRLPCPACHEQSTTKQTVSLYDDGARWYCFRCNTGGDVINWLAAMLDVPAGSAIRRLCGLLRIAPSTGTLVEYLRGVLALPAAAQVTAVAAKLAALRALRRCRDRSLATLLEDPTCQPDRIADAVAWYQHAAVAVHRGQAERMPVLAATISNMRAYGRGGVEQVHEPADHVLLDVLADEAAAYHARLADLRRCPEALAYLRARSCTAADLRTYGMGLCLNRRAPFDADGDTLHRAGICYRAPHYGLAMSGRLVLPFRDAAGRVVALAGRSFYDAPKWLNTADTAVFAKRCYLFGLDVALPAMLATRRVVLCEGYSDPIAVRRAGFPAVATAGTALTPEHVATLRGLVGEVILFFDGDEAGAKATAHAADILRGHVPVLRAVARPPGSPDPDECPPEQVRRDIKQAPEVWAADPGPAAWAAAVAARLG